MSNAIRHALIVAAAALSLAFSQSARAQCDPNLLGLCPPVQETKLLPLPDGDQRSDAWFGYSVAIHDDLAVVGAPVSAKGANWHGVVYVFRRRQTGWILESALVDPDRPNGIGFGEDVAVHGDAIVIPQPFGGPALVFRDRGRGWEPEAALPGSGAVWVEGDLATVFGDNVVRVYQRRDEQWSLHANLPCQACDDYAAHNLAFSGDTLIAGSPEYEVAHVYTNLSGAPYEVAQLTASDGQSNDQFGSSVAIDGDVAVVGARTVDLGQQSSHGAAYVFERDSGAWKETAKLVTPDLQAGAQLGSSVALRGNLAFVGARIYDLPGESNAGAVFEYRRAQGQWILQRRLTASDADGGDQFGNALAADGNRLIVGAMWANVGPWYNSDGFAYIFKLPCYGDMNCDGTIGQADLAELLASYGCTCCRDIDGDFDVDQADLAGLLAVYNQPCPE